MKLHYVMLTIALSSGLLSGCAYIEGRKDQQQQVVPPKTTKGHTIQVQGNRQELAPTPNASETAAKMITPIVQ
jgi:hypothetical protein